MTDEYHKEYEKILIHATRECLKNEAIYGTYCLDEQVPKELNEMTINFDRKPPK